MKKCRKSSESALNIIQPLFCCGVYLGLLEIMMEQTELKSSQVNLTGGEDEELPSGLFFGGSIAVEQGMPGVLNVFQFDFPSTMTALSWQGDVRSADLLQCAADIEFFALSFASGSESEGVVDGDDVPENKVPLPEEQVSCKR